MRSFFLLLTVAVCISAPGCGSNGIEGRKAISGTVTLDGQPLDRGMIQFEPQGAAKVNAGVAIENGQYTVPAEAGLTAGTYRVSITSAVQPPFDPKASYEEGMKQMQAPKPPERVPAKYNRKTELIATVTEEGPQVFNFDLKSK